MFSVIVPVHNKMPHLDRTINSILQQTFQEFELILVDDASTDGSSEKIEEYTDSRIRIFKREIPGPGGYAARNLGIKEAKHEWIAFLDADDEWDENYLEEIYKCIREYPDARIVTTKWLRVTEKTNNENLRINNKENTCYFDFHLTDYLKKPDHVWTGAVVVNTNIVNETGGFPMNKLCKRGGDVDTWIRWLDKSKKNILINKVLSYYHQGTVNQVTTKPNTHFCAYETLKELYMSNSENKALSGAVKQFSNAFMYNMLARQVKYGMAINFKEFKKFYLDTYSCLRMGKLLYLRFKYLLERKG